MADRSDPRLYAHGGRGRTANRLAVVLAIAVIVWVLASFVLSPEWTAGLFMTVLLAGCVYVMLSMWISDAKQDMETYNSTVVRPPDKTEKTGRGAFDA
jgi:hypothetical protein